MTVGTSKRTLGKHVLLNKILGREAGMMAYGRPVFINKHYFIIDLCAGDGSPTYESGLSSPAIIQKHVNYLLKHNVPVKTILIEKNINTFDRLKQHNFDALHLNCNAQDIDILPLKIIHKNSAAFIHADPNHIEDWPISKKLLHNAPEYTTLLVTLGCNVGGLKRLPFERRQAWYDRMDELLRWLPQRHDALLVVLRGDRAQWAYLVVGPKKWHSQGVYKKDVMAAFNSKTWPNGVDMVQFKANTRTFYQMRDKLFMTTKELAANA